MLDYSSQCQYQTADIAHIPDSYSKKTGVQRRVYSTGFVLALFEIRQDLHILKVEIWLITTGPFFLSTSYCVDL